MKSEWKNTFLFQKTEKKDSYLFCFPNVFQGKEKIIFV